MNPFSERVPDLSPCYRSLLLGLLLGKLLTLNPPLRLLALLLAMLPQLLSRSFSPIGYSDKVGVINMAHQVHSTSISLILILGSVFFILLVTAFITCITRRKRAQQQNEDELMSQRVSDHIQRRRGQKKDPPPNYVTVIKMKEEEDLPSYSEAVSMEAGMSNTDDNKDDQL